MDNERVKCSAPTVEEIERAEQYLCRAAQDCAFLDEVTNLKKKGKLRLSNRLLTLHFFLDTRGLLRVGGRIGQAKLPFQKRHPILLPRDHRLTRLIAKSEHEKLIHAGSAVVYPLLYHSATSGAIPPPHQIDTVSSSQHWRSNRGGRVAVAPLKI